MEHKEEFPLGLLFILALTTFAAIISELGIPGILPEIAQAFDIPISQAGNFVSYYALSTAIFSIPITQFLLHVNRKLLMMGIFSVYSICNLIIGLTNNYSLALINRVIIGIAIAAFWPIVVYYTIQLVSPKYSGRAITLTSSGATFGILLGVPFLTALVQRFSWRAEFISMALFGLVLVILIKVFLPSVPREAGGETETRTSFFDMFKNPAFMRWLLITLLVVLPQYASYVYITQIVEYINYSPGVVTAQFLYGLGTLVAVVITTLFIDKYFYQIAISIFLLGGFSLIFLFVFNQLQVVHHFAFFAWGLSYGPLTGLFQTAVTKLYPKAASKANSVSSSTFNVSIMLGSSIGGWLLANYSVPVILLGPALVLLFSGIYTWIAQRRGKLGF